MDLSERREVFGALGLNRFGAIHENLPPARLVEAAVRRREAMLAGNGAIVARTGKRTGRSPKDKFIVEDETDQGSRRVGKREPAVLPGRLSPPCSIRPPRT